MPRTYDTIASATGTGSSNAITFSSIPSTYTDLVVVVNGRMTGAVTYSYGIVTVNGDASGSSYSRAYLKGDGSAVSSGRDSSFAQLYAFDFIPGASASSDIHNAGILHIMNYANANVYKSFLVRDGAAGSGTALVAGTWRSTAAINSVTISAFSGNWTTSTTILLYGIRAA